MSADACQNSACQHDKASHYYEELYVSQGEYSEKKWVRTTCLCRGCECARFVPRGEQRK
jgi:hypothetical protein